MEYIQEDIFPLMYYLSQRLLKSSSSQNIFMNLPSNVVENFLAKFTCFLWCKYNKKQERKIKILHLVCKGILLERFSIQYIT